MFLKGNNQEMKVCCGTVFLSFFEKNFIVKFVGKNNKNNNIIFLFFLFPRQIFFGKKVQFFSFFNKIKIQHSDVNAC